MFFNCSWLEACNTAEFVPNSSRVELELPGSRQAGGHLDITDQAVLETALRVA
jgi:hypothetical protein